MLQVARLAPKLLGEASELVTGFLRARQNPDGGFADRAGNSDLYYTVFGLEGLLALRADVPFAALARYLRGIEDIDALDLVHVSCLARCWATLPIELRRDMPRDAILRRVENFRTQDGAYSPTPGAAQGTIYGCFVATGTYQDCDAPIPSPRAIVDCVASLRADDGGYANQQDIPLGLTPSTAAAVTLLRQFEAPVPPEVEHWLLARCHKEGGFFATPVAPIPDLLSTATALHALAGLQADLATIKEPCLDFIDTLWTNQGAFYGNWEDDTLDCEYTYYALLALGHLSL